MAELKLPDVNVNANGWGPCSVPQDLKGMFYLQYPKVDKFKPADWAFQNQDQKEYQLVDQTKQAKPLFQRNRRQFLPLRNQQKMQGRQPTQQYQYGSKNKKNNMRYQYNRGHQRRNQVKRFASINVKSNWAVIEEMDFTKLSKCACAVGEPEDLYVCGSILAFNKAYDKVTTRNPLPLHTSDRTLQKKRHTTSPVYDPVFRDLSKRHGNVFITDSILSTLMTSERSKYSWDVVVTKLGKKIFFEKREESLIDYPTVSETGIDGSTAAANNTDQQQPSSANTPDHLRYEAFRINNSFLVTTTSGGKPLKVGNDDFPFESEDEDDDDDLDSEEDEDEQERAKRLEDKRQARMNRYNKNIAYRYRKFHLTNEIDLVVRAEHHAYLEKEGGGGQLASVFALNEWNPTLSETCDWRQSLHSFEGRVFAAEMKNNNCKISQWLVQAIVAGSEIIKFGYVSRNDFHNPKKGHTILGTAQYQPARLAQLINVDMTHFWGVIRHIVNVIMQSDGQKFVIMRDPSKDVIRIYQVPKNADDDSEDSDDDDSDDSDEEDESDGVDVAQDAVKSLSPNKADGEPAVNGTTEK